jgi:hypothetical protein
MHSGFEDSRQGEQRKTICLFEVHKGLLSQGVSSKHVFPVGDPGCIHFHTVLRAIRAISRKGGVYAHIFQLAIFTVRNIFLGSDPRWLPVRMVSRSKHVASKPEGLLSLNPPFLQLSELSWHVSFSTFQRVRYPVVCWLGHRKYKSMKIFVKVVGENG